MANVGKQMVLGLKIQAAHKPSSKSRFGREVVGGYHLVDGPFVGDALATDVVFQPIFEMGGFNGMSQLANLT